jgi:acetyltransferase-like isoleucine patch superfamily enzyme
MSDTVLRLLLQPPRFGLRAVRRCHNALLRCWLRLVLGRCGRRLQVQRPFVILGPAQVAIGDDVSFGAYLHIWGMGGVTIVNRVMIGSHVSITSLTHDYTAPVMKGTSIAKPVIIEDDVWIGAHCTILPGVHIGQGAVVGAGAVVAANVSPDVIVAGVPAHFVRSRPRPVTAVLGGSAA